MRSDYLRMCYLLAEGGMYVDADDVLLGDGWRRLFIDPQLKVQPLCYDITTSRMVPAMEFWNPALSPGDRIFYANNDPIVSIAGHPVLAKALVRATNRLLGDDPLPQIQETTGPGNMTAALTSHANELAATDTAPDFSLIFDWEGIAEMRWDLAYRRDARNWRNVDGSGF
jgi:hypothetical protein